MPQEEQVVNVDLIKEQIKGVEKLILYDREQQSNRWDHQTETNGKLFTKIDSMIKAQSDNALNIIDKISELKDTFNKKMEEKITGAVSGLEKRIADLSEKVEKVTEKYTKLDKKVAVLAMIVSTIVTIIVALIIDVLKGVI